jgi:hypothetical protein
MGKGLFVSFPTLCEVRGKRNGDYLVIVPGTPCASIAKDKSLVQGYFDDLVFEIDLEFSHFCFGYQSVLAVFVRDLQEGFFQLSSLNIPNKQYPTPGQLRVFNPTIQAQLSIKSFLDRSFPGFGFFACRVLVQGNQEGNSSPTHQEQPCQNPVPIRPMVTVQERPPSQERPVLLGVI